MLFTPPAISVPRGRAIPRAAAAAVPLIAALTLTGCVNSTTDDAPLVPSAPTVTATDPVTPSPNPSVPVDDATVEPVPEASTGSQAAAIDTAEKAVAAYARPDLGYDEWINRLYPYLSQTGTTAYEDTDPARVPARQVTGAGTILPASTEVALIVQVPTDAGPYNVSLSRPGTTAPWLADRIRPAAG